MNENVNVSNSPHIKDGNTTNSIMLSVIISLIPTTIYGVCHFGLYSLIIIITCIMSCMLSEYFFNIITKRDNSLNDYSAIVTGLLLGLNVPPRIPLYIPILGSIFAIVVAKMIFGGLGQNFVNPAIAGRIFLTISFANLMNSFSYDTFTGPTPLYIVKQGMDTNIPNLFIGNIQGTIGEVSSIAILIGAIYLLIKKIIDYRIPLSYFLSFLLFILIFSGRGSSINYILTQIFGGGLLLGMFFMATDYVTSPVTKFGRVLFGIFLGIMTGIFRIYGKSTEGVSFSILLGNLLVPFIEQITIPKAFGVENINEK